MAQLPEYFDFDQGVDNIEGNATRQLVNLAWASRCCFSGLGHPHLSRVVAIPRVQASKESCHSSGISDLAAMATPAASPGFMAVEKNMRHINNILYIYIYICIYMYIKKERIICHFWSL